MKKLLFVYLCLSLVLSLGPSAALAQSPPPDPSLDPEPPVAGTPPEPGAGEAAFEGGGAAAILESPWTAPFFDLTRSLAWGDYDNDGDLDLLVGNEVDNRLYQNTGGTLSQVWTFDNQSSQSVAWGDYDRDGYLDIAVGNSGGFNHVFHNEGNGTFIQAWEAMISQNTSSVAWAGWETASLYTAYLAVGVDGAPNNVYRHESGEFVHIWTGTSLSTRDVAWGDYDNDGDPDLAVGNYGQENRIYRNDGGVTDPFGAVTATIEISFTNSVAWGDMNGDGYLDLAVGNIGSPGNLQADQVYCNLGPLASYAFAVCWTSDDPSPTTEAAWGDYDGDGDLDLAASSGEEFPTRIYLNNGGMLESSASVTIDDEDYDGQAVAWGDWDGDGDLELALGYYEAAQANMVYDNTQGGLFMTNVSSDLLDTRSVAWGDMDGDGFLDLAVGNSSLGANQVFTSTGESLVLAWTSAEGEHSRSVAWGDFDGDDDLDLAVGNGWEGAGLENRVYINNGTALSDTWTFGGYDTYGVAWGDFDGDQDLDLAVGNYGASEPNQIFVSGVSGGTAAFTGTLELDTDDEQTLCLAWADFDQDHDLDLAVGNYNSANRVYVNDGGGAFPTNIPLPGTDDTRSIAWGDWDDDGDVDLAVGNAGEYGFVQVLEAKKNGSWSFAQVFSSIGIIPYGLDVRSVAWGDYDGDGDLDLGVGVGKQWDGRNLVFRNEGGTLVQSWTAPAAQADLTRSVAWGDYDNDGDLDLASGNVGTTGKPNRLYINNWNGETDLANDPNFVVIEKPGDTENAWFFANYEIIGEPEIEIVYRLYDDEGDRAFEIEPQVSWDGGDHWQAAWEAGGDGTTNLAASPAPTGTQHVFLWDAFGQLLDHQGLSIPAAQDKSDEEMDVAFRIVVWSNPEHGGLIQRPAFGTDTTLFRLDLRPDWTESVKLAEPQVVTPGEEVQITVVVTQTDHGMPDGTITDPLPIELSLFTPPTASTGAVDWTTDVVTWTGALEYLDVLQLEFSPEVARPLTNGLEFENCAYLFDGLHAQFTRCTTMVVSSAPVLTESFKLVFGEDGLPADTAQPGDLLTYTLVVSNTGTDNAYGVVVTDALPPDVEWADQLAATSGTASYADRVVTWEGDVLVFEPVTITYQVTVAVPLADGTLITNTFWVSDGLETTAFIEPPITTTIEAPDLRQSTKVASSGTVELGDVLTYTITLTNDGSLDAGLVELYDPIPPYCSYVPGSYSGSAPQGGYDAVQEAITWAGPVNKGGLVTISFAIIAGRPVDPDYPVITNTAVVSEALSGEATVVATTTVWLPDFETSYKKASTSTVEMGDLLAYTIHLTNTGGYAPVVQVEDPIPKNSSYVPGSVWSSDGMGQYGAGQDAILWTGEMTTGAEVTITFAITAGCPPDPEVPVITNTAEISYGMGIRAVVEAGTDVLLPDLSGSAKVADTTGDPTGRLITYTIIVSNTGLYAPGVWVSDTLPAEVGWRGNYAVSQGTLTYYSATHTVGWDGGALDSGSEATITFMVLLAGSHEGGEVTNVARIGYGCDWLTREVSIYMGQPPPLRTYVPIVFRKVTRIW